MPSGGTSSRTRSETCSTAEDRRVPPELRPRDRGHRPPTLPEYRGRFLHRDFHPGNVLFDRDESRRLFVSGVVDWMETSWGPSDLDVVHCSTTHALLYGVEAGLDFPRRYLAAGGDLSPGHPTTISIYRTPKASGAGYELNFGPNPDNHQDDNGFACFDEFSGAARIEVEIAADEIERLNEIILRRAWVPCWRSNW